MDAFHARKEFFIVLGVAILGGILFYLYGVPAWQKQNLRTPSEILLRSATGNSWYRVSGDDLQPIPGPSVVVKNKVFIAEAPLTLSAGTPILGSAAQGSPARYFGIVTPEGAFFSYIDDVSPKHGLAVRADGLSAFAYVFSSALGVPSVSHIAVIDALSTTTVLTDLGNGDSPAFAANGDVVAFAPEGLVEINPATGKRTVVMPVKGSAVGAYAPDASFVIVRNPITGADDVFSVNPAQPSSMSYLGSLPVPLALGTFPGGFIAETGSTDVALYNVSRTALTMVKKIVISK